ncbi:MAG: GH92 family glycosyl hydrolase [Prevotella sp.]|nr:GH92 family glycosyl hydrolase [Prevotella sp.]
MTLTPFTAHAQYEKYGGVYYAYQAPKVKYTPVPKGYKPFYISHYGRHGSRWMPKDSRYEWIAAQFEDESNLTDFGLEVKRRLQPALENARGNGGKLTPLGAEQHRQIARRMYRRFKEIFRQKDIHISARSSTSPRCAASMRAFCEQLRKLNPALDIVEETDQKYMYYIAYTSPEEEELERDTVVRCKVTGERLAGTLYKDPSKQKEPDKLLSELHTLASSMQDIPLKDSFWDLFTEEEIQAVYDMNNTRMRLVNGIDPFNHNIPARCAASLWQNIVETADSVIATGTSAATLRFGHDTCLYHLLSLLGFFDGVPNLMDEILPMGANLQIIFYRNAQGNVIVKFLHNEKELRYNEIDCYENKPAFESPYYDWEDIKHRCAHWLEKEYLNAMLQGINTFTGTSPSITKTAGLFGKKTEEFGQTLPAVLVPNGMNFWTPQTRWTEKKCVAPYYYMDTEFQGFRNSHWIVGGCTQDYGSFTLAVGEKDWPLNHEQETSRPDYYAIVLLEAGVGAEMTATSRAAIFRFTPLGKGEAADPLLADRVVSAQKGFRRITLRLVPNSDEKESTITLDAANNRLYATNPVHRIYQGWGESAGFTGHYVLTWKDRLVDSRITDSIAYLTFEVPEGRPLIVKAASSFTGKDGAWKNLQAEIPHWDFLKVRMQLNETWLRHLSKMLVEKAEGGEMRLHQFYGALYRASFLPHEINDVDGRYPQFAGKDSICSLPKGRAGGGSSYMDFSMWDTYRAVHPLLNIISPTKSGAMMQSLVRMYEQGGWLPIFPCWNSYTAAMIGDHCVSVLADAYVKGIRNFDAEKAYEAMRKNAFETPASVEEYKNGMGRRALQSYLKYGYIPLEDEVSDAFHTNEQVSRTLEYAYDDFCVAQMAKALGKTDDYKALMVRSENWRNVLNPQTGYVDGRYADGRFQNEVSPFQKQKFITEGAPCHYSWYVPQNPKGLIEAMGGREQFVSKLDSMFTEGRYWHGNEPCHQVAYMFNYAGEPWRTQKYVRHILDTEYLDDAGGLSGNDDAGQMSAWLLFSYMGFYPVCPATPYYMIGSPVFPKLTLNLENGKAFTIIAENASSENIYIQRAELNGQPYTHNYLLHEDIMKGGELHFVMGNKPNPAWGRE